MAVVGRTFEGIDDPLRAWIAAQSLFFVGTAPLAADGHVNVSPKGPIGSLRVVDARTVAYLDTIGSGAETLAHLRENGRIVVMLCAFVGPPRILRLYGRGEAVLPGSPTFAEMIERLAFDDAGVPEARRAIVVIRLDRIADSCGYGVPRMQYRGERSQMRAWGERKLAAGADAIDAYRRTKNATSIDGLPALDPAEDADAPRRPRPRRRGP